MVCIDKFDGIANFRGLGELSPQQIATLEGRRLPVSDEQLQLAVAGWCAFRSDDPRDLERFITGDLSALPFLGKALRRHLQEYPWRHDGLTRTERQIARLVGDGITAPGRVFVGNMDLEDALFLGDWSTFRQIDTLCRASEPLLRCAPGPDFQFPPGLSITQEAFRAQRLELTDHGRRVLAGEVSAHGSITRDLWLGGVHLQSGQPMWTWDDVAGRLRPV
ncbi:MAG: hypothetical protein ACR2PI_12225 [Hyphomicrobiaceae bacterium]